MNAAAKLELKKLTRSIDDHHDTIQEELDGISAEHERLLEQRSAVDKLIRDNEAKRDSLVQPLHAKRLQRAAILESHRVELRRTKAGALGWKEVPSDDSNGSSWLLPDGTIRAFMTDTLD